MLLIVLGTISWRQYEETWTGELHANPRPAAVCTRFIFFLMRARALHAADPDIIDRNKKDVDVKCRERNRGVDGRDGFGERSFGSRPIGRWRTGW